MVNGSELLINVVTPNKPKVLTGLSQKGKWPGARAIKSLAADEVPPAERQDLTHSLVFTRNVVSPYPSRWESESQGEPIGVRVEDDGGSEGHLVMRWIGVTPRRGQHHPTRKRADFHQVFRHKRA
jgi:hypothetical protein